MCGVQITFGRPQRRILRRLFDKNVQRGAGKAAAFQSVSPEPLRRSISGSGIHDARGLFHLAIATALITFWVAGRARCATK